MKIVISIALRRQTAVAKILTYFYIRFIGVKLTHYLLLGLRYGKIIVGAES